ncbi:hypothetical protein O181_033417 [Austropuccinia psidii MF-1]|uniref:DNA-directed RNA polymerase III subunit n=1 Tax=Austropuccinia psidii MF-1 TaxID=1389203 RepID=A0A9Q3D1D0_9BASI|nr:hypothetical protein [Austropuccinia psidii MF-1]
MKAVDNALGFASKARIRKIPKIPQITSFPKAPIGLPLEFYSKKWLNCKFSKEFVNIIRKKYGPDKAELNSEGGEAIEENDEDMEEGVIDLEQESEIENNEEEYVKDGKWGQLYDDDKDGYY